MTVKIPSHSNKPDLNIAYKEFNTAKYWACHKGATFKQLFPTDLEAYKGYVHGEVSKIVACTRKLTKEYGRPAFKAGDRAKARDKYYSIQRKAHTKGKGKA